MREEFRHRYRGLLTVPFVLALTFNHWRVIAYIATETPRSVDLIKFIESQVSCKSVVLSLMYASAYVIIYPWLEHAVAWFASTGRRKRDEFQAQEVEKILAKRKIISEEEARLVERELKTKTDQSKKADIDRALEYQNMLGEQSLERAVNESMERLNTDNYAEMLRRYIQRSDQIEGQFINAEIQGEHVKLTQALSALEKAFYLRKNAQINVEDLIRLGKVAREQQKIYRKLVRDIFEI